MKVEVVRSRRRTKTIQARFVGGVLRVLVPASLSWEEEQEWVHKMIGRMERKRAAGEIDLAARARQLAARYDLRHPVSIRWVDNQEARWGSCTPSDQAIRLSSRLAKEPGWVIDYVIVHELAHLSVHGHGPRFWQLVDRYPLTERARGFLIARGIDADAPPEDEWDGDGWDGDEEEGHRWDGHSRDGDEEDIPVGAEAGLTVFG